MDPWTGSSDEKWVGLFAKRTTARFIGLNLHKWAFLSGTWIPASSDRLRNQCWIGWVPEISVNICKIFRWTFSSICCLPNINAGSAKILALINRVRWDVGNLQLCGHFNNYIFALIDTCLINTFSRWSITHVSHQSSSTICGKWLWSKC